MAGQEGGGGSAVGGFLSDDSPRHSRSHFGGSAVGLRQEPCPRRLVMPGGDPTEKAASLGSELKAGDDEKACADIGGEVSQPESAARI